MDLVNKLGKKFIFSTELGGINGTLLNESIEKAKGYEGLRPFLILPAAIGAFLGHRPIY